MGLTRITAPTVEPLSLSEAKAHCRIYGSDDDGLIAGYIMAAVSLAENSTNRALATQTWELTIDRDWPEVIVLPRSPTQSVTSVTYYDSAGSLQTLASNQYRVDVTLPQGRIEPAYDVTWPVVRDQARTIIVRFVAGYTQIPEPIRQALLLLVGHFYENREAVVVGQTPTDLPLGVDALLFPYRIFY